MIPASAASFMEQNLEVNVTKYFRFLCIFEANRAELKTGYVSEGV